MKTVITIVGILMIIFGIATLAYKGFSYKTEEPVAQLGDLKLTTESQNRVYFPPLLGGASIAVGIVLVIVGRKKSK